MTDESALRSALASLDESSSSLHWWLGFWTLLVAVGVVLEVVFVIWEYCDELHDFKRGIIHPPEHPPTLLFVLGLLGAGLVAAGVSGELWEESRIAKLETCIRKGDDALFLLLSKEAGDAQASARQAKADAKTARDEADAATTASREAQTVASGAKTSASEAQDKVASVSKQAGDIDNQLKLALSMLSVRKVRDIKRMKELVAKYAPWQQPVVVKSYVGDWESFWACLSLVEGLSMPESTGMLKQVGTGCGAEPIPSSGIPIDGIALHMGTPVALPVLIEGFRLLEILRGDGGLGNFSDIGGGGNDDGPKDHIDILVGLNPAFSLERMQWEQERLKKQNNQKKP